MAEIKTCLIPEFFLGCIKRWLWHLIGLQGTSEASFGCLKGISWGPVRAYWEFPGVLSVFYGVLGGQCYQVPKCFCESLYRAYRVTLIRFGLTKVSLPVQVT